VAVHVDKQRHLLKAPPAAAAAAPAAESPPNPSNKAAFLHAVQRILNNAELDGCLQAGQPWWKLAD
jgi:hypothetical protein